MSAAEIIDALELPIRNCRECGRAFRRARADQVFCTRSHKNAWHRRAQVRGGQAYALLMEWRITRGGRKGVLSDIAAVVDRWIEEDRERHSHDR